MDPDPEVAIRAALTRVRGTLASVCRAWAGCCRWSCFIGLHQTGARPAAVPGRPVLNRRRSSSHSPDLADGKGDLFSGQHQRRAPDPLTTNHCGPGVPALRTCPVERNDASSGQTDDVARQQILSRSMNILMRYMHTLDL